MIIILLILTLLNLFNAVYAFGIKYAWFGPGFTGYFEKFKFIGTPGISVMTTLAAVLLALFVLVRYRRLSEYDQQFERGLMKFAIVCSVLNVWFAASLMFITS